MIRENENILMPYTHIVTTLEGLLHVRIHVVMIQGHEKRIDHDTERDEQLDEGIEHNERYPLLEL